MPVAYWNRLLARLAHALAHADLVVDTDGLTPEDVLQQVLQFVESKA
jgi:chloramphenicol 3-O-phosphotransferase